MLYIEVLPSYVSNQTVDMLILCDYHALIQQVLMLITRWSVGLANRLLHEIQDITK